MLLLGITGSVAGVLYALCCTYCTIHQWISRSRKVVVLRLLFPCLLRCGVVPPPPPLPSTGSWTKIIKLGIILDIWVLKLASGVSTASLLRLYCVSVASPLLAPLLRRPHVSSSRRRQNPQSDVIASTGRESSSVIAANMRQK